MADSTEPTSLTGITADAVEILRAALWSSSVGSEVALSALDRLVGEIAELRAAHAEIISMAPASGVRSITGIMGDIARKAYGEPVIKPALKPNDRVYLDDSRGRQEGEVKSLSHQEKMVIVRWDSGMVERVEESELDLVSEPADEARPSEAADSRIIDTLANYLFTTPEWDGADFCDLAANLIEPTGRKVYQSQADEGESNTVRPDGPETEKGGLIGQEPY